MPPDRNARFIGDEFDGIDAFPFASPALNRVPVSDALVTLATTLLGTDDIRLYSAEAWAKYEGAADYDQDLHRDYLNHTIVVPSSRPALDSWRSSASLLRATRTGRTRPWPASASATPGSTSRRGARPAEVPGVRPHRRPGASPGAVRVSDGPRTGAAPRR